MEQDHVVISVRGMEFYITRRGLRRAPNSLLAENYISGKDPNRKYYYRNPFVFQSIADYYETGRLHFQSPYCLATIRLEMEYWKLDLPMLMSCCWDRLCDKVETEERISRIEKEWCDNFEVKQDNPKVDGFDKTVIRSAIFDFLEKPYSSKSAKIFSSCIMILVLLSVLNLMLQSIEDLRIVAPETLHYAEVNLTEGRLLYILMYSKPHPILMGADFFCSVVFTVELLLRFFSSPETLRFLKSFYTITDLVGVMPMWVLLIMQVYDADLLQHKAVVIISMLRLFRIFRLARLIKHVPSLKLMVLAAKNSYQELLLMLVLLTVFGVLFSFLMYYSEVAEDNYDSVMKGLWWALVTMTTVGYGDVYPVGSAGKVVGALCAVSGILVIAMPVPIIVKNFSDIYSAAEVINLAAQKPEVPEGNEVSDVIREKKQEYSHKDYNSETSALIKGL